MVLGIVAIEPAADRSEIEIPVIADRLPSPLGDLVQRIGHVIGCKSIFRHRLPIESVRRINVGLRFLRVDGTPRPYLIRLVALVLVLIRLFIAETFAQPAILIPPRVSILSSDPFSSFSLF